jgi:hypothetical protein
VNNILDVTNTATGTWGTINAGQVSATNFSGSGSGIQSVIIQTNFIDGQKYTNNYGVNITVSAPTSWTMTGVSGVVNESLCVQASPLVGGITNTCAMNTLVTSLATTSTNSPLSAFVPTNAIYWFTNLSAGTGDSASVKGGQIKYP